LPHPVFIDFISRPYLIRSRLCYRVASVCRLRRYVGLLWLNGAS